MRTHTRRVLKRRAGGARASAESTADDAAETPAGSGDEATEAERESPSSRAAPSKPAPGARPVRPTGARRPTGKRNVGRR